MLRNTGRCVRHICLRQMCLGVLKDAYATFAPRQMCLGALEDAYATFAFGKCVKEHYTFIQVSLFKINKIKFIYGFYIIIYLFIMLNSKSRSKSNNKIYTPVVNPIECSYILNKELIYRTKAEMQILINFMSSIDFFKLA